MAKRHVMQPAPRQHGRKRWWCDGCGSIWSTPRPVGSCPGVPLFRATEHGVAKAWELAHQAGLYTRTQWKARQRIVLDDATPAGIYETQRPKWFQLFSEAQTRPVKGSEAQLALGEGVTP
jgi:hypothetical protein